MEKIHDMNLTKSSETRNQYMVTKDRFLIQVYKNKENKGPWPIIYMEIRTNGIKKVVDATLKKEKEGEW